MIEFRNVDNLTRPGLRAARRDVVRIATGPWAGRVGEVQDVKGKYLTVRVDPKWTRRQREEISAEIATLRDEGYDRTQAVRIAFEEARKRSPESMKFLINPPERPRDSRGRFKKAGKRTSRTRKNPRKGGRTMAERWIAREHPRNARGQFIRTTGRGHETRRRRNAPARLHHPRRRAYHHERWVASEHPRNARGEFVRKGRSSRRRNPYHRRRNPGRFEVVEMLKDGVIDSVEIIAGKAAVRSVPQLVKLPTTGNVGIAVQVATALVFGFLGDKVSPEIGRNLLAGALTAPLEDMIVTANVPWISNALTQAVAPAPASTTTTTKAGTTSGYARGAATKMLPARAFVTSPPGSGVRSFGVA